MTGGIRLVLLAVLLVALTGPRLNIGGRGIDVVVVADRSRSMPAESHERIRELIENLEQNRGDGDNVGLVTYGAKAEIEHLLSNKIVQGEYTKEILPDGSDLESAITTALNVINPGRPGEMSNRPARILVLSDGESNGANPMSAARRAREVGVPIDVRLFERMRVGDVAIESVLLPEMVSPREPFQFSVWIYADREAVGIVKVLRDGEQISLVEDGVFHSGMNRLLFRDLLEEGGLYTYSVELEVENDPLVKNNIGKSVVRVDSGPKLLVLTTDGAEGNLVGGLKSGRVPLDVRVAKDHPLTQDSLDQYRGVIIENVPADDLGRLKMERLAQFVEDLGGGLMLTGGRRSFGTGGYFKSPLDDILPVSMEMREEQRKTRVAIAIALDRSGSMTAPVAGGKTKMDLANLGTAECVRLLSPSDRVAIIAVDSQPHVIQALTPVDDKEAIANRALKIESMGGGIFVYEALVAAGKELMKAGDFQTRHIILFSDAADSEEPGAYKTLLGKFNSAGITVSVIGLGTKADVDAKLLEDIAKLGNGNIMFTTDPKELPRLFTQDTMSIARSTFVTKDETQPSGIPGQLLPDSRLMGELGTGAFPNADGYNLSYLKPEATAGVISRDDYKAPWSAFWYRGLGRVAALSLEVDGKHSGAFGKWDGYNDFLITHARWLLGGSNPDEIFLDIERRGQDAVATVELDPERPNKQRSQPPKLIVVPPGQERADVVEPEFVWTGPDTLQARFRMDRTGTYRTLLKTSERQFARGPAVTLPYSPEYVPRVGLPDGKEVLTSIMELSGGKQRTDVLEMLSDPPRAARTVSLLPTLFIASICLLILEIAGRRLSLWERVTASVAPVAEKLVVPASWLPQIKLRFPKRKRKAKTATAVVATSQDTPTSPPKAQPSTTPAKPSVSDAFERAKQRARKRLK